MKKTIEKKESNMQVCRYSIQIPEGSFSGNCRDCMYADWSDRKSDGRVYCRGPYGGYNYPENRNGCFHYVRG